MTSNTPSSTNAQSSPGRIFAIAGGTIVALLALACLALGGTAVGVHETQRDASGFSTSSSKQLGTPTYALTSDTLEIGTDPAWLFRRGRLGTIRVAATGAGGRRVFVGIAKQAQVERYLAHVRHDTIADVELDPFSVTYGHVPGTVTPSAPGTQRFWASKAIGKGQQTLSWPVQAGDWTVVVMNADGSPGILADVKVGAKVGFLLRAGVALLVAGGLLAALAAVLLLRGGRPRSRPVSDPADPSGAPLTPAF